MKKFYFILIALLMMSGACQRSQFSTTTRHYKNGKVIYANHHQTESKIIKKAKSRKVQSAGTEPRKNLLSGDRSKVQAIPGTEIQKINPVYISAKENLIASTSLDPDMIVLKKEQVVPVNDQILLHKKHKVFNITSLPDSIKSNPAPKGTTIDSITQQVIKFKSGLKETVRVISRSRDILKYESVSEPGVVRTVMMGQVDTILQVKVYTGKDKVVDTRKTEPLARTGFIFSMLSLVPLVGIPFALLAVVFSAISLGKIHRHPEKYKGKRLALASLIIGILSLVANTIIIIAIIAIYASPGSGVNLRL